MDALLIVEPVVERFARVGVHWKPWRSAARIVAVGRVIGNPRGVMWPRAHATFRPVGAARPAVAGVRCAGGGYRRPDLQSTTGSAPASATRLRGPGPGVSGIRNGPGGRR